MSVMIHNVSDLDEAIRTAQGSVYPVYFLCADGEPLSLEAVRENREEIDAAVSLSGLDPQWEVVGYDVNWEDVTMVCSHTGLPIPSAYT